MFNWIHFDVGSIRKLFEFQEGNIFQSTPFFGAKDWERVCGLSIEEPTLPKDMEHRMDQPCPFWRNQSVRETHLLCLVPGGISPLELWKKTSEQRSPLFLKVLPGVPKSYWILITKKIVPGSRRLAHDQQLSLISDFSYRAPKVLEVMSALLAFRHLTQETLYRPGCLTRCEEIDHSWPVALGGDLSTRCPYSFDGSDWNSPNGMAAVLELNIDE